MAGVERHDTVGGPIDGGFQNHFIRDIAELGAPKVMKLDGLDETRKIVQETRNRRHAQTGGEKLFGAGQDSLIFQKERDADQHPERTGIKPPQKGIRSACTTAPRGNQDICVNHSTYHIPENIILRGKKKP